MRPVALDQARVFLIVAAYNEAASIGDFVRELREQYPNVIVVDDGSHDETAELADEAGAYVLTHLINRGQGAALQTGITYALGRGADYIVTLDVDGQYDVGDIAAMLTPIVDGQVHATLGSRFAGEASRPSVLRRMGRLASGLLSRLTARARPSDAHNGLRAFSRHAAQMLDLKLDRMPHASETVEQVAAAGLPLMEVPVRVKHSGYALRKGQRVSAALRVAFQYLMGRFFR
jgi:glycosyltransferase involved in cell wall biosynthesis